MVITINHLGVDHVLKTTVDENGRHFVSESRMVFSGDYITVSEGKEEYDPEIIPEAVSDG